MKKILIILLCLLSLSAYPRIRYLSPRGNNANAGTDTSSTGAWGTWQYAATNAVAGDTVYAMGGVWYVTGTSAVATFPNSGTYSNRICFFNYPGKYPIIDGRNRHNTTWNTGLNFSQVAYIKLRGIEIRNFWQPSSGEQQAVGMGASDCANLEFENMKIHQIGGSAVRYFGAWRYPAQGYVGVYPNNGFAIQTWYNLQEQYGYGIAAHGSMSGDTVRFINCDSYNVTDTVSSAVGPGGSADGFKFDNEIDSYVEFIGCRAWHCSDDGFDISGSVVTVFKNCWSIGNGLLSGDGSGFKCAYPRQTISTPIRYFYNCMAVNNRDPAIPIIVDIDYPCMATYIVNCFFYNNDRGICDNYGSGLCVTQQPRVYRNNLTYASKERTGYDAYSILSGATHDHNSWDSSPEVTVTNADFVSLDSTQLWASRKPDGSLPNFTFGRLATISPLKSAGVDVGMSSRPDIGIDFPYYDAGSPPPILAPSHQRIIQASSGKWTMSIRGKLLRNGAIIPPPVPPVVSSIHIAGASGATTISIDDGTLQMYADVSPNNALDTAVIWSRTNVSGTGSITNTGLLTALTDGTVTVRATANDGSGVYGEETITNSNQDVSGNIIADHSIVDDYDIIPQEYIDIVKGWLVTSAGMSHSQGYYNGVNLLELLDSKYQATTSMGIEPLPIPDGSALIVAKPWNTNERIWTSATGIANAEANHIRYAANNPYDVYIFGWSYQATWTNGLGGGLDPVYNVHYAGSSEGGPEGDLRWGLDAADQALTGNSVCVDTYLAAWEEFQAYADAHFPSTQMVFSTLIVDGNAGTELAYQRELKSQHIRDYITAHTNKVLFDFGDILTHNNTGEAYTSAWDDNGTLRYHPQIHPDNLMDYDASWNVIEWTDTDGDHIGEVGALRLGKALWWMLARMAGWDGLAE